MTAESKNDSQSNNGGNATNDPMKGGAFGKIDPGSLAIYESHHLHALQDLRDCVDQLPPDLANLAKRMTKNLNVLEGKGSLEEQDLKVAPAISIQKEEMEISKEQVVLQVHEHQPSSHEKAEAEFEALLEKQVSALEGIGTDERKQDLENAEAEAVVEELEEESSTLPIVQFTTSTFFAAEGEDKEMSLDVMRIGDDSTTVSCRYRTEDLSAKAGAKYEAKSGEIVLKPGETLTSIAITILDDDNWDATLEFMVVLEKPVGSQLGRNLYKTRVKIIDNDLFPSNVFAERIRKAIAERTHQRADFPLMMEYFKMNLRNPTVKKGTQKMLIYGQAGNLYFILQLILTKHLIDKVLGKCQDGVPVLWVIDCPESKDAAFTILIIFMFLMIVPFTFVHLVDYRKNFWKIGGASRKTLQSNLLRKYLNYDEESRGSVANSHILMAINRDSSDLVSKGYLQLFPLAWSFTRLFFIIIVQLIIGQELAIIPVVLFPLILMTYLKIRSRLTKRTLKEQSIAQDALINSVEETTRNFRIIADYAMRPNTVDQMEILIGSYNSKAAQASAVMTNNKYLAPWLSTIFVGLWFVIGGRQVVYEDAPLGGFLTTLGIFKEVGSSWSAIYGISLSVQSALVPLSIMTGLMNLPTDLDDRKRVNEARRQKGKELAAQAHELAKTTGHFAADLVPIKLIEVSYKYQAEMLAPIYLNNCEADLPQGSLVAIVGPPGSGKSTMLKLIGGVLFPQTGVVAVPPHLRVLHISQQPIFFKGTLLNNLIYGLKNEHADAAKARVFAICKALKVPEHLHPFLDTDESDDITRPWDEELSISQRAQLNLARALVNNPNLLVFHKPTLYLNDELTGIAFRALKQFVDERGIAQSGDISYRRFRTCIVSTSRSCIPGSGADQVYEVRGSHMRKLNAQDIQQILSGW